MSNAPPTVSPVFVDPTGKRRRRVRVVAVAAVASLLATGALVVVALLGVPIGPSAYLPEPVRPPVANHPAPATEDTTGGPVESTAGRRPTPRTAAESGPAGAPVPGPATSSATTTTVSTTR
jgi:hypothetical protein